MATAEPVPPPPHPQADRAECLELIGCYATGKVKQLAEIVTATVLAGEISLACALVHGDWVPSPTASATTVRDGRATAGTNG